MKRLSTADLKILNLAIKEGGTFDETNLENSSLRELGVGRILDALASLKDRGLISLEDNGSFLITDTAREILWSTNTPLWARILRLLQIKSCSMSEISEILREAKDRISNEIEELRRGQLVLMSPQRINETVIKVFEILPKGAEEIDRIETEGFERVNPGKNSNRNAEILDIIDTIQKEIQDSCVKPAQKESMVGKLADLREKLEI